MQGGGVSRIRLMDVPSGRSKGKHSREIASIVANVAAGIGPQEALEVGTPFQSQAGGHYLAKHIKKALVANKLNGVDILVRTNDKNETRVYVVGI